jgi:hypothetical protein
MNETLITCALLTAILLNLELQVGKQKETIFFWGGGKTNLPHLFSCLWSKQVLGVLCSLRDGSEVKSKGIFDGQQLCLAILART